MPEPKSVLGEMATGSSPDTVSKADCRKALGSGILLAVAVFLVFGRTVGYQFVNYDDDVYCYSNPHVQDGLTWSGVTWAVTTGYDAIWHPLTWLSHMLDVEVFGPGPAGPHFTNVLLHAATAVLLLRALWFMTGALWPSAFVAAVFALHPLRVESVAWIADRKDLLSGLFFMLMLGAYARYARKAKSRAPGLRTWTLDFRHWTLDYSLALVFLALGLMSKPMLVTAPLVLLLLDWWPLGRFQSAAPRACYPRFRQLLLEKIPFLLLSAICGLTNVLVQPHGIARIGHIPLDLRLSNAIASSFSYLEKMVYPVGLAVFYPYSANELLAWKAGLGLILLIGLCLVFFKLRFRQPYLLVGWLWYLGMLIPVSGLIKVEAHARADRYTYLPQIGVCLLVAWAVKDWFPSWRHRRQVLGGAAVLVLAALMTGAFIQTAHWRNSEALWTHTLACASPNYVAYNNLALVRVAQGRLADASEHFREALEINPRFVEAHNNFGLLLAQQGQSAPAMLHFRKAIELQSDFAEAHNNLANVLAAERQVPEAISQYETALQIKPDYPEAHYNLGNTLAQQGRYAEAIQHFQRALQINPAYLNARQSLDAAVSLSSPSTKGIEKR